MRKVTIGEHYTYDDGYPDEKLIMFVIRKSKYEDEDVFYYDTISLYPSGKVLEKAYEEHFFQYKHVRLSTLKEIQELRNHCPITIEWAYKKMEQIIKKYWDINIRPEIIFDRDEPLENTYLGAYDPILIAILFRSEFLILKDIDTIEKVLKHELCHWYLHVTGQEYKDEDVRFAKEIIRLGIEDTINSHNEKAYMVYMTALKENEMIK